MPDFIEFLPLLRRSIDEIRAQVDTDANAGIDPADDRYVDTTVGGFFHDLTQAVLLEIERMWDFLATEVPAAGMLPFAFGTYLDDWGDALGVPRKDEVRATGSVTLTADADGAAIGTNARFAVPPASADEDPIAFEATAAVTIPANGTASVPIRAVDPGSAGNVSAGQITQLLSPITGTVTNVTNPVRTLGGTDVETDEAYRDRLLLEFRGAQGSGTIADYQRWALAEPGVGYASVQPIWNGPGTVRVVITDIDNRPVPSTTVDALKARLDPVSGEGRGTAPIGHTVTVTTPTSLAINIGATVVLRAGYSLTGQDGTVAVLPAIQAAIEGYVNRLTPGDDVVANHVEALFFGIDGIYDVQNLKLNGGAVGANVEVGPTQVAYFDVGAFNSAAAPTS